MKDGSPPIGPGSRPCASKYGTARPVVASVGYQAWAMTWRWSDGLGVSVSARRVSVQRKITLPTPCGPGGLGNAGTIAVRSTASPPSASPTTKHYASDHTSPTARVAWSPSPKDSRQCDGKRQCLPGH
jgi:hypothetical protein